MLKDDFYFLIDMNSFPLAETGRENPDTGCSFLVTLRKDHPVYGGHFPGNPVVPGVCQVGMIRELASLFLDRDLVLRKADSIKFLSVIRPDIPGQLKVDLEIRTGEETLTDITATISGQEQVFLKFRGKFNTRQA